MDELNRKMAGGALWMAVLRLSVRGLGLISTVILARLLVPEDFGLVSMATAVLAFLELATAFSFDIPLIQNQGADRTHFDTAWTLNLIFYAALTLALVVLAEPAAHFYREPRLPPVIYVLGAGFLAQGFENVGVIHFRKDLDFRRDFVLQVAKKALGFLVVIPSAYYLRNYWALVIGIVLGNVLGVVLTYVLHPYRPRFALSAAAEMLNFSKWLVLNNAFSFLRVRSPDFVIGRVQGSTALGLFNVALDISIMPTTELVAPINRVVFPGYSRLAADPNSLKQSYLDVLAVIAVIALPAGFGVSAIAAPLVDLFLGPKWIAAVPLVQLLAIFGALNALLTNSGSLFNALAKPHLIALVGLINIVLLLGGSIPLELQFGPIGVAVVYVGTSIAMVPITFYFVWRETALGAGALAGVLWRPMTATAAMYGTVKYVEPFFSSANAPAGLIALIAVGAISYSATLLVLWLLAGKPYSADYRLTLLMSRKLRQWRARRVAALS